MPRRALSPPPELLELLEPYDRGVQELALALRGIVIEELAPCYEGIYEVYILSIAYASTPQMMNSAICYIGVMKGHVNLGFHRGAKLSDSHGLLEGTGKAMRHIKMRSMSDVLNPAIRSYLQEACELVGHDVSAAKGRTVETSIKTKSAEKRSLGVSRL